MCVRQVQLHFHVVHRLFVLAYASVGAEKGDGATGAADDAAEAVCASDGAPAAFAAGDDVWKGAQHHAAFTFVFNG